MADYGQTDITLTEGDICGGILGDFLAARWRISAGAASGTVSHSAQVQTAGTGTTQFINFGTVPGDPGTATWMGAFVVRFNITTANTNCSWQELNTCQDCFSSVTAVTVTSALGISLGTTGVKTASVEVTAAFTVQCGSGTAYVLLGLGLSSGATMNQTFNYLTDQVVTVPFTASAAPAPSVIYTLAQMGVGL